MSGIDPPPRDLTTPAVIDQASAKPLGENGAIRVTLAQPFVASATLRGPSGTTLQSVTYTRDDAGRSLTRVVAPNAERWTYTYDGIHRLLAAANSSYGTSSRPFTYDDAGNTHQLRG